MEHKKIASKLSAFVDDEVTEAQKAEITAHLSACSECRDEIANFKLQIVNLKVPYEISPSSAFRVKVNAAIDSQKPAKASTSVPSLWKLLPVPAGLSLLILVFSAYMLAAPVLYGMNNENTREKTFDMARAAVMTCFGGGVFAPAAFAKFCGMCTANACACSESGCAEKCKMMKGEKHGN